MSNAMEISRVDPNESSKESMIPAKHFIDYMNRTINNHVELGKVGACLDAINFACSIENEMLLDAALKRWTEIPDRDGGKGPSHLARALIESASKGNCNIIEKLLKVTDGKVTDWLYCSPDAPIYGPITAIGLAAHKGHHLGVRLLLAHNANPELGMPRNDATPLRLAINNNKLLCTQEFFKGNQKANPNSAGGSSFGSILHWTLSREDRNEHAKVLIEHGADVNFINAKNDPHEGTPLMVAVAYANLEGVQLLLAAKADAKLKHPFNSMTAKELAEMKIAIEPIPERKRVRKEIFELLKQAENYASVMPGA